MAGIALTTIGLKISYAVEQTSGVRPTDGYIHIKGLKGTPDFNTEPNTFDTTTFENEKFTSHGMLLSDLPGSLAFEAVFSQEFADDWDKVVSDYSEGMQSGLATWFCIDIPGFDKSIFFSGQPVKRGWTSMEANTGIDSYTVYIIPSGDEPQEHADPTYSTESLHIVKFTVSGATTGDLVEGAVVSIISKGKANSDSNGEARFNLKDGNYEYTVKKAGIASQYGEFVVSGENVNIDVTGFNA